MKKTSDQIVFFGSGPVAAKSLELLIKHHPVIAVITKPATVSLMKSVSSGAPIYSVSSKSELDKMFAENTIPNRLGILIDFGIIVSEQVINHFENGILNSHFSLLPEWRGADPITFSLLSGQKSTGVSLMLLSPGMDEGPILSQSVYDIPAGCTNEQLSKDLIYLSDSLLSESINLYLNDNLIPMEQEAAAEMLGLPINPTYSRKLTKVDGLIDWKKPAEVLEREIRAFHSWPKSFTQINGIDVIIREAEIKNLTGAAGDYEFTKKSLTVYCGKDALEIKTIQPSGKKEMPIQAFLAGYKL